MRATDSRVGLPLIGEGVLEPLLLTVGELRRLAEQDEGGVVRRGVGIADESIEAGMLMPARPRAVEVLLALLPAEGELLSLFPQQSASGEAVSIVKDQKHGRRAYIDAQS